jgi:hypothetical protein
MRVGVVTFPGTLDDHDAASGEIRRWRASFFMAW